ncbi:MAG: hypothetical protein CBR30_00770 [Dictyoglomus sp. NZ13-RE01]|nr:MAG: hypothetical protein CBR30_00770 [Dictyoglomus sp. NZ13-RE01]
MKKKQEKIVKIVAIIVAVFFLLSIFIIWGMYIFSR